MLGIRTNKVFHFHLLKLARGQDEISGRNLVAKRLANLRNPKGNLSSHGVLHIQKVDEDALRRLRPQIRKRCWIVFICDGPKSCTKHHVERPWVGEIS